MDIVVILVAVLLGISSGILIGLLPGVGPAAFMLVLYPILFKFDIISLLIFYFALINTTQYYGSISAIIFGIAGEVSSIPAVKHGHQLFKTGYEKETLIYTSTGSFIASIIALLMFAIISLTLSNFFLYMLQGKVIVSLLITAFVVIIVTSERPVAALIFGFLGIVISQVGFNPLHRVRILTFGYEGLDTGIPMFPIFCGLLIIPMLIKFQRMYVSSEPTLINVGIADRFKILTELKYLPSMVRGAVVGFFIGLIPGCSYTISSNVCDVLEGRIVKNDPTDERIMKRLISAESANNAGTVSVLIPLIMLAIPIVFSEAILMGVLETKGFDFSTSLDFFKAHSWLLIGVILIVNIVNWVLTGVFFNVIISMYVKMKRVIYLLVSVLCLSVMIYNAVNDSQLVLSIITFVASLILGISYKHDQVKFVLIYTFFVSSLVMDEVYRIFFI
jgi:putative tricarboxylic transport membrane protein